MASAQGLRRWMKGLSEAGFRERFGTEEACRKALFAMRWREGLTCPVCGGSGFCRLATRIPIEQKESVRWLENLRQSMTLLAAPARCVHVGDRESDIYELYCTARELGTHFVVRSCVDRLAGEGR